MYVYMVTIRTLLFVPTFCRVAKKNSIFFLIFAKPYHSHSIHISVFFSDGMYSVLTILCNYLQMMNQITLFMKKNILKY